MPWFRFFSHLKGMSSGHHPNIQIVHPESILIVYKNHEQFISPFLMKILFVCSDKSLVANKLRVEFKWKDISAKSLLLVMILFLVLKLLLCLGMWSTEPGMG